MTTAQPLSTAGRISSLYEIKRCRLFVLSRWKLDNDTVNSQPFSVSKVFINNLSSFV